MFPFRGTHCSSPGVVPSRHFSTDGYHSAVITIILETGHYIPLMVLAGEIDPGLLSLHNREGQFLLINLSIDIMYTD